jgi:hypothetical protein
MSQPLPSQPEEGKDTQEDTQWLENHTDVDQDTTAAAVAAQDEKSLPTTSVANQIDDKPYSAFTQFQKSMILVIVAAAGVASTLSSSIYLPALTAIQNVRSFFNISNSRSIIIRMNFADNQCYML